MVILEETTQKSDNAMIFMKNKHAKHFLQLSLILWICFIWFHSAIPASGSSEESRIVGDIIRPFLEFVLGKGNVTDHIVRKLAHFTEYTILGLLIGSNVAIHAVRIMSSLALPREALFFFRSYGLLFAIAVALIDESIQIFSPGRSPQVTDVLLDTAGSFAGLFITMICCLWFRRFCALRCSK